MGSLAVTGSLGIAGATIGVVGAIDGTIDGATSLTSSTWAFERFSYSSASCLNSSRARGALGEFSQAMAGFGLGTSGARIGHGPKNDRRSLISR
jgi:hypothetical protein